MNELPRETILERLRKIQALAESGIEGERANAQRLLDELTAKYGVTLEELTSAETFPYRFKFRTKRERQLLNHVVLKICQTRHVHHRPGHEGKVTFWLTRAQSADVADAYAHYRKELNDALDDVLAALINKHRLFAPAEDDGGDEKKPLDAETIRRAKRIFEMMSGLSSRDWKKTFQLENS